MLISTKHKFVLISMPKCASTSTEAALAKFCNLRLSGEPKLKHSSFSDYQKYFLPYLQLKLGKLADELEVVSLFRHPISWLNSWYRFRIKEANAGQYRRPGLALATMTFDDFLDRYTNDAGFPTRVGRQVDRLMDQHGAIGKVTLFRYEGYDEFLEYLSARFGRSIRSKQLNASPGERADISPYLHYVEHPRIAPDWAVYRSIISGSYAPAAKAGDSTAQAAPPRDHAT